MINNRMREALKETSKQIKEMKEEDLLREIELLKKNSIYGGNVNDLFKFSRWLSQNKE